MNDYSLSDLIAEDYHALLLERGNLLPEHRPPSKWTGAMNWESDGYLARLIRTQCRCGSFTDSFQGLFRAEHRPGDNARRLVSIDPLTFTPPSGETSFPIERTKVEAPMCVFCLPSCFA